MDAGSLNNSLEQAQNLTQAQSSPLDLLLSAAQSTGKDKEISLKTLKKQEIDKIMQSFKQCREIADRYYTSKVEPKLKERREIYLARADHYKKKFKRLSELTNWCSRDVKTTIDWILPSLIEVYTGGDDPIDIKGVNVEDDDRARKLQQLLKYQMERKNSYFTFLDTVLKDALILNMGAAKVWWKREEKREAYEMLLNTQDVQMTALLLQEYQRGSIEIQDMEPIEGAPDLFKVTFERVNVTANHPVLEYLPPSELRYTPEASNLQSAKFTAHRKVVRGDYLIRKEREGVYENVREALAKYSGNTRYTAYDREHNPELSNAPAKLSDNDTASKEVELYEGYLQVDYNNDGVFEDVIVHAVGDTPIRIAGNDFEMAPFFVCAAEYDPSMVFGEESFADNLEQLQDLKTALVRQIIINVAKNNAPQKFVNETNVDMDALINNEEHVPVMGTSGSPRDNVFVPDPLPLSPATMMLVEYAQNEIEAQSGSTRYNQGLDSNSLNKTATGITAIMGSAEKRLKHYAKQMAENFVVPLFRFLILLNQKYLEEEQMIRLTNENVVIRKEELDIDYDLMINVGQGAGTREAQIQYLMILINQIYPQLAQQGIVTPNSWYQIVKDLLEKMGVRNTAAYLADPNAPEMQQRQQQAQQQAIQAQQMQMQAEIAKASVPRVSVKLEDLPMDAKLQFIQQKLGLQTTPKNVAEKELVDHA